MRLASIKLISGEEILAEVMDYIEEEEFSSILIRNPIKVELSSTRKSRKEYKLSPWIVFNKAEIHEINIKNIIGMCSVKDEDVLDEYDSFFTKKLNPGPKLKRKTPRNEKFNEEYGYLGSVKEFRDQLERLYKMDSEERPKDL